MSMSLHEDSDDRVATAWVFIQDLGFSSPALGSWVFIRRIASILDFLNIQMNEIENI